MLFNEQSPAQREEGANLTFNLLNRRTMVKRLGLAAAAGTLAVSVSPALAFAGDSNRNDDVSSKRKPSGFNVLLAHGAYADASSWNKIISFAQEEGHNTLAVQLPLATLAEDVEITKQALASLTGPTVVVGHSYGGAVITGAAYGVSNVIGLVYASAFVPKEGETLLDLVNLYPPTVGLSHTIPSYRAGFAWIDPAYFPEVFAADVELEKTRVMAVEQKPLAFYIFNEKAGPAAWTKIPSWYLVSKQDKTINPNLERFMAKRIGATTIEVDSSHASPVSHPRAVFGLIQAAIKSYKKA